MTNDNAQTGFLADASALLPQYMRRVVCQAIGRPEEWDWAIYVGEARLDATLSRLRPHFARIAKNARRYARLQS